MTRPSDLDPFFYPESITIVGASQDETRPSGIILKNLLNSFNGKIYPVNPKYSELNGIACYPSVTTVPDKVSLSILITPTSVVPELLQEHGYKGIRNIIITSAGFGETESGIGLEREIKEIALNAGIRIIGPNCLGVFNPSVGLDTFFLPYDRVPRPHKGHISLISQSGSILGTAMILLEQEGLGVAKAVSYGNRVDVSETELLEYLSVDDDTKVIGLCIEGINDGRGFIRAAQRCDKPVVAIKLGREPAGKKAARSHTGSMAGRYEIYQAAFRRGGIYEARTIEEFIDLLKVFNMQKPGEGKKVLIITNAGGISVMTADLCNQEGLEVPDLPPGPKERLKTLLPPYYSLANPVDLTGNSTDEEFVLVLGTCLEYFDAAILIPFMTVPGITPNLGNAIINSVKDCNKPILSLSPFSAEGERLKEVFNRYGIPILPTPDRLVKALAHLLRRKTAEPFFMEKEKYQGLTELLDDAGKAGVSRLSLKHKHGLLDILDLKYPRSVRAKNLKEAISAVQNIGIPVALKIASPDILHKTDVGGVRLGINNIKDLRIAYREMINSVKRQVPQARILGVDIEEMIMPGIEVIIGGIRDQQFGSVVMFGLGGVFVEVIKDVIFEIAPVTHNTASRMLESIKGYDILKGVRGRYGADMDAIANTIVKISEVISLHPEIKEIELNPAIVYASGLTVADARIILASKEEISL